MSDTLYLHGQSEPEGVQIVANDDLHDHTRQNIRDRHAAQRKGIKDVTILAFGVDHGLGAHAGNGDKWRTTVVAQIRLDYLNSQPIAYARLEGEAATELLAQLAQAVAVRARVE